MKPRIALFELRMLGDAVMSFPFIRGARAVYDAHICCHPGAVDLFARIVEKDRIVAWAPPWSAERRKYRLRDYLNSGGIECIRGLRALRPDVAVCAWADTRVHLLMALSGARRRVGLPMTRNNYLAGGSMGRSRARLAGRALAAAGALGFGAPLLTHPIHRASPRQSHLDDWKQVAAEIPLPFDTTPPWFPSRRDATASRTSQILDAWLGSVKDADSRLWVVHPGARLPTKRWPAERFQVLLDTLFRSDGILALVIHPPDGPKLSPRGKRQLAIETPTIDDLIEALDRADGALCNDSFAAHLAAALGKRVVTVFGSGEPDWFAPFANRLYAVSAPDCPAHPCMDRCVRETPACIEGVSPDTVRDVVLAADSALRAPPERPNGLTPTTPERAASALGTHSFGP